MRSVQVPVRSFVEEARRRQIVDAAIELLASEGYSGASLAAIAEHIGVSKGVISYHFDGKEELLQEVVSFVIAGGAEYMGPRLQAAKSAREALTAYVAVNLEYVDAYRTELDAMTEVLLHQRNSGTGRTLHSDAHDTAVEALTQLVAVGQRTREFRRCDATIVAQSVRAAIDSVPALLRADPDLDVARYARELSDLFLRALAP